MENMRLLKGGCRARDLQGFGVGHSVCSRISVRILRMVISVVWGGNRHEPHGVPRLSMVPPLVVLTATTIELIKRIDS